MNIKSSTITGWTFIIVLNIFISSFLIYKQDAFIQDRDIDVCFSPGNGCDDLIVRSLRKAKRSIYVHAFSFTSEKIANTLIDMHNKGILVTVLYDKSSNKSKHSKIPLLHKSGINVKQDLARGYAHNKIMIIDQEILITGSYNWSMSAENRDAENLLFIRDQFLINKYIVNWYNRLSNARAYQAV